MPDNTEAMSDELFARVIEVRNAATRDCSTVTRCSVCGDLETRTHGVAIHAVSNPGHIVTHTAVVVTTYQDKGRPINAGTT